MKHLVYCLAVLAAWSLPALAGDTGSRITAGDLVLEAPFARATLPNQPVAGLYLTISNTGEGEDVLEGVSAPFAARGEIHEMSMDGDTMLMRPLPDGLPVPAGATVTLSPGGVHLMFMGLIVPLTMGDTVEATLVFRDAGEVTVAFPVLSPGAKTAEATE